MINIDVICLTNTNDEHFYWLTKRTIDTLLSTKGDYKFNIKLIESNKDSDFVYDYPNLEYIKPNQKFHYNRFLNIGLDYCTSEWVLIINNDLVFTPEWLESIISVYNSNNEIKSFSSFEPNFANRFYPNFYNEGDVFFGYQTTLQVMGWCLLIRREIFDIIGKFDERFNFWCQDDDYAFTLQKHNIKHALVKNSIVYHETSKSHTLINKDDLYFKTSLMARELEKKWGIKKFRMRITQVTPGVIPIPPNGWGAVEKIIWNYHNNMNELGHISEIKYLNDVDMNNTEIVHIHIANLAIEAYNRGIPYIFSLHDHHVVYNGKDSFNYRQNLEAIKKSVISFCHAEFLVDYFDETDKLFYLSHGVDTNFFKVDNPIRTEHRLLCLANNGIGGDASYDRKGFRYAIEAAKMLDLPITIAGPENNKNFFQHHLDLLEYDKLTLDFNNPNEESIIELYKNHSIFLHPSSLEAGHPNLTLLEAVSCNLPVVGTYDGTQKIHGMIVCERDSEMVASSIKEIINNYEFYVNETFKNKEKFDWMTISKRILKMYETVKLVKKEYDSNETKSLLMDNINNTQKTSIESDPKLSFTFHFVNNPFFEIKGDGDKEYKVEFYDGNDNLHYSTKLKPNMWTKLSRQYFTEWSVKVYDGEEIIYQSKLNFTNKRVFIAFDSSSLGDSIAWVPYMSEFKKKHNCDVIVSTFRNDLYKNSYPDIEFIEPGEIAHGLIAMYNIGWYYDNNREPMLPNTIPLQKAVTNILGLEHTEIKPNLDFTPKERPMVEKYITISTESTAGLKYWNYPNGWQELVNYLTTLGYKVVNVSKDSKPLENVIKLKDESLNNVMNVIHHSEFFIGLSSGLSWLSWALGKHVVMISNFTEPDHEFTTNCTRITNPSVCNGCWNNPMFKFDKGDWNWCPEHKGTERQFECHKSITTQMVIDKIQHLL